MPTYVYETTSQPVRRYEIDQRMKDEPLTRHPETGEEIHRVISGGLGFLGASDKAAPAVGLCGNPVPQGGCGSGMCGHSHH